MAAQLSAAHATKKAQVVAGFRRGKEHRGSYPCNVPVQCGWWDDPSAERFTGAFIGGHEPDYLFKCTTLGKEAGGLCDGSCEGQYGNNGRVLCGPDFEKHCGRADAKNWKLSIRVRISKKDEMQFMGEYPPMREYLRVQSTLLEASGSLVGKRVSVWGPFDENYFNGTVESWDPALGKHCVRYDAATKPEDLHLAVEMWDDLTPAGTGTLAAAEGMSGLAGGSQRGPSSVRGPQPAESVPCGPRDQPAFAAGAAPKIEPLAKDSPRAVGSITDPARSLSGESREQQQQQQQQQQQHLTALGKRPAGVGSAAEGQAPGGGPAQAACPANTEAAEAALRLLIAAANAEVPGSGERITAELAAMQQPAAERQTEIVELKAKQLMLLQEADGLVGFRSAASGSSAAVESEVDCAVRLLNDSSKVEEDKISAMQAVIDDVRALELWFAELKPPALPEPRAPPT